MAEGQTTVVVNVVTNLMWTMVLCLGSTVQLVGNLVQQCYMPYGYVFSNHRNIHVLRALVVNKRKITSIFEIQELIDEVEVAAFVMCEYAAGGENSIY